MACVFQLILCLQYLNYCHLELDNCALQQYANFRPLKVVESRVCNDNAVSLCDDGNCAGCPRYVRHSLQNRSRSTKLG